MRRDRGRRTRPLAISSFLALLALVALLVSAVSGCGTEPQNNGPTPLDASTPLVVTWSNGTQSGLLAVSGRDGKERWRNEIGAPILPPLLVGDVLYASVGHSGAAGQDVVAVRASDGGVLWRTPLPANANSSVLATDGATIAVNAAQQGLIVLDATTGAIRWQQAGEASGQPAVRGGVVYASIVADPLAGAQRPTGLSAFRASDGALLWTTTDVDYGRIEANSSVVYSGSLTTPLTATRSSDGKRLWQSKNKVQLLSATDTMVLVTGPLTALDPHDGSVLWSPTVFVGMTGNGYDTLPQAGETIYGPNGNNIIALRASDGTQVWRVKPSDYANSDFSVGSLFVTGDVVFALLQPTPHDFCFSDCDPRLVALDGTTGAVYWQQDATGERLLPERVSQ